MYIFKNALVSIKRNVGRNILIGIIVIVISAACAITLSIMNSANKIVTAYEEKYQIKASLSIDRSNLMESFKGESQEEMIESFNDIEEVTVDEINTYGDSEYVKSYYYTYSLGMNAKNLTEATDSLVKETTTTKTETSTKQFSTPPTGGGMQGGGGGSTTSKKTTTTKTEKIQNMRASNGAFTLTGYSSYEAMTDFIEGSYTITEGSVSNDFTTMTCVISEELATLNSVSVGDTITLVDTNNTKLTYKLEVTGIYKENSDTSKDMTSMFTSSANNIITNSTVVETILAANSKLTATITPTFILNDEDDIEAFAAEVKEKGLSEYYTVSDNLDEIESATKSITNVKSFSVTFLIITLIIGGVVLLVINMINIRERKYEIGVLRTIGMSKFKVISQFVFELLFVSIISLLMGAGIGSIFSVNVANSLLASEISNSQSEMDNINKNFGGKMYEEKESSTEESTESSTTEESTETTEESKKDKQDVTKFNVVSINEVDSINAIVDFKVLLELLGIGVLLTLISSLSACIAIARFSPLTILKERS